MTDFKARLFYACLYDVGIPEILKEIDEQEEYAQVLPFYKAIHKLGYLGEFKEVLLGLMDTYPPRRSRVSYLHSPAGETLTWKDPDGQALYKQVLQWYHQGMFPNADWSGVDRRIYIALRHYGFVRS